MPEHTYTRIEQQRTYCRRQVAHCPRIYIFIRSFGGDDKGPATEHRKKNTHTHKHIFFFFRVFQVIKHINRVQCARACVCVRYRSYHRSPLQCRRYFVYNPKIIIVIIIIYMFYCPTNGLARTVVIQKQTSPTCTLY